MYSARNTAYSAQPLPCATHRRPAIDRSNSACSAMVSCCGNPTECSVRETRSLVCWISRGSTCWRLRRGIGPIQKEISAGPTPFGWTHTWRPTRRRRERWPCLRQTPFNGPRSATGYNTSSAVSSQRTISLSWKRKPRNYARSPSSTGELPGSNSIMRPLLNRPTEAMTRGSSTSHTSNTGRRRCRTRRPRRSRWVEHGAPSLGALAAAASQIQCRARPGRNSTTV